MTDVLEIWLDKVFGQVAAPKVRSINLIGRKQRNRKRNRIAAKSRARNRA